MSARYRKPRLSPAALAKLDQTHAQIRDAGGAGVLLWRVEPVPVGTYECVWCDCSDDEAVLGRHDDDTCRKCPDGAATEVTFANPNTHLGALYTLCDRHRQPWWEFTAAMLGLPIDNPPTGLFP